MKTASDPRHRRRAKVVQLLYEASFSPTPPAQVHHIWTSLPQIDPLITKAAPQWPTDKINRVDLAILRLAVWELTVDKRQPPKVIIDEAIELAKEFGSESSPSFINGCLGAIIKS